MRAEQSGEIASLRCRRPQARRRRYAARPCAPGPRLADRRPRRGRRPRWRRGRATAAADGCGGRACSRSSRIGFSRSIGTIMLRCSRLPFSRRLLELQRADAEQVAVRPDQRGAAPVGMRRRGEDRLVEHVFPIAGEFLPGRRCAPRPNDARPPAPPTTTRSPTAARARTARATAPADRAAPAPAPGRTRSPGRSRAHGPAPTRPSLKVQPDRLGLGDQIADGQHDAVLADRGRRCRRARCRASRR